MKGLGTGFLGYGQILGRKGSKKRAVWGPAKKRQSVTNTHLMGAGRCRGKKFLIA